MNSAFSAVSRRLAALRTSGRVAIRTSLAGLPIRSGSRPFSITPPLSNNTTFTLDKSIFNQTLYKQIQTSFFQGHNLDAKEISPEILTRWFGGSPEEREAFDTFCRQHFGPALEAIGPDNFPNPTPEPFIHELKEVAEKNRKGDGSELAWTALSIALLLDQVPRNIYRTRDGLFKVYNHYDKMACPLMLAILSPDSPIGRPDLHPQWRKSMSHRMWFYLPLMHSEEIAHHDLQKEITMALYDELVREGGSENQARLEMVRSNLVAQVEHREILEKFGRYCHRNQALGRKSTREEEEFLLKGGATFGVAQDRTEE